MQPILLSYEALIFSLIIKCLIKRYEQIVKMLIEIFFRGPVKADAKADGKTGSPPRQDWSIKEAGVKGTECSLNIVFFSKDFRIFRTLFFRTMSVCVHTPGR